MKNARNYIVYGIVLVSIILTMFLLRDWWSPAIINYLGGYSEKQTVTKIDTLEIRRDSIYPVYEVKEIPVVVALDANKIDSIMRELLKDMNNKVDGDVVESLRYYSHNIEDSILKGSINTVTNTKDGVVVKQDFKYTPKVPMYIKEYVTIKEQTTETLTKGNRPLFGAGFEVTSEKDYGINVYYKTKNNILINAGIMQATEANRQDYIKVGVGFLF